MPVVKLGSERHHQLARLAEIRRTTMVGLVDELIEKAIVTGELPDNTPGVRIEADGDAVSLFIADDQSAPLRLTKAEALDLAGELPAAPRSDKLTMLESGSFVRVVPVGPATRIVAIVEGHRDIDLVVTASVAAGLARQLHAVAQP